MRNQPQEFVTGWVTEAQLADDRLSWRRTRPNGEVSRSPTPDHDRLRQRRYKAALRASGNPTLAYRLESCRVDNPCLSGACPVCVGATQVALVAHAIDFIHASGGEEHLYQVSLVGLNDQVDIGRLSAKKLENLGRRTKDRFSRAGAKVDWAFGAIDLSLNEADEKQSWCPHVLLLAKTVDPIDLKRRLKNVYPADESVPRPVKVTPFKASKYAVSYLFKTDFRHRVSYVDENGRANTDKKPLPRREPRLQELLAELDELSISKRLIWMHCKPNQTGITLQT